MITEDEVKEMEEIDRELSDDKLTDDLMEQDKLVKEYLRELPNDKIMRWLEFNWEEVSIEFKDKLVNFFKPEIADYIHRTKRRYLKMTQEEKQEETQEEEKKQEE